MDIDEKKLTQEEICLIVESAGINIANQLNKGSVIVPKLINAAFEFFFWLKNAGKFDEENAGTQRDVVKEMYFREMKKMVEKS